MTKRHFLIIFSEDSYFFLHFIYISTFLDLAQWLIINKHGFGDSDKLGFNMELVC